MEEDLWISDTYLVWGSIVVGLREGVTNLIIGGRYFGDKRNLILIPKFTRRENKKQIKRTVHELWVTREQEKEYYKDLENTKKTQVEVIAEVKEVLNFKIPNSKRSLINLIDFLHRNYILSLENLWKYFTENVGKKFHILVLDCFRVQPPRQIDWDINPTSTSNYLAKPQNFPGVHFERSELKRIDFPRRESVLNELEELGEVINEQGDPVPRTYSFEEFLSDFQNITKEDVEETGDPDIEHYWQILQGKGQIIFYGVPGTGKTYLARRVGERCDHVEFIQFHPNYSYEEFIGGIFPKLVGGKLTYVFRQGHLLKIVQEATRNPERKYCLIIDEINRGNLPKIMGELLYAMEYRGVPLRISHGEQVVIPNNLFIVGTMNTSDRSLAEMDQALRRRFSFIEIEPSASVIQHHYDEIGVGDDPRVNQLIELFNSVNQAIVDRLDPDARIGHSYFMLPDLEEETILNMIYYELIPFLEDLFYQNRRVINTILGHRIFDDMGSRISRDGLPISVLERRGE